MDLRTSLTAFKESIMSQILVAVSQKDTQWIVQLGTFAKHVDSDLALLIEIEERTRTLKNELDSLNHSDHAIAMLHDQYRIKVMPHSTSVDLTRSSLMKQGKDAARRAREEFFQTCKNRGVRLLPKQKTIASTSSGARIALPFGREHTPDKWFFGVDEGSIPTICPYSCIVFLCGGADESVLQFILPQKLIQKYWNQFSRHEDNVKFNIKRESVNFALLVPGYGPVQINTYQDAYDHLKSL